MALISTGTYILDSVSGTAFNSVVHADLAYCKEGVTTDSYAANQNTFGFAANTIVITNESANDLAYQYIQFFGGNIDCGIVKGNSTIILRQAYKKGIAFRSRSSGQAANFVVSAI